LAADKLSQTESKSTTAMGSYWKRYLYSTLRPMLPEILQRKRKFSTRILVVLVESQQSLQQPAEKVGVALDFGGAAVHRCDKQIIPRVGLQFAENHVSYQGIALAMP